jgi:hypothetical protein
MKKFVTAIVLLGSTSLVHADYALVPSDSSELSKLCIAAASADSREAVLALTGAAGFSISDLPTVRCNGMPITRFAAKYGSRKPEVFLETSSPVGYLLRKSDASPLTELCAAAAVSDAEYVKVKESHFGADTNIEAEVHCNGVPLKSFVRKFRNASATLASN